MREEYCEACETLKDDAYTFATKGVTTGVANRLKQDNGFASPSSVDTDCEALNIGNDCLIGGQEDTLEDYDVCDIKVWLKESWANLHTILKAMIAAICGIWTKIHCILSGLNTLISQLTKEDSFAAETHYSSAGGAGSGLAMPAWWSQYIVPKISDTKAASVNYDSLSTLSPLPSSYPQSSDGNYSSGKIYGTITGPADYDEIVYPADGVALVGCCGYIGGQRENSHLGMHIVFYTDKDTQSISTMTDLRGLHFSSNRDSLVGERYGGSLGNFSNSFTTAIKVKAGSKLRIYVEPSAYNLPVVYYDGNGNVTHNPSEAVSSERRYPNGDPTHDADITYPSGSNASFYIHQIWSTFVPNFSSALNVDPTIFDSCGE